jgi:hypothetical protein
MKNVHFKNGDYDVDIEVDGYLSFYVNGRYVFYVEKDMESWIVAGFAPLESPVSIKAACIGLEVLSDLKRGIRVDERLKDLYYGIS